MANVERWAALVAWAAWRGVGEADLVAHLVRPLERGGMGWRHWQPALQGITEEGERCLRRWVESKSDRIANE